MATVKSGEAKAFSEWKQKIESSKPSSSSSKASGGKTEAQSFSEWRSSRQASANRSVYNPNRNEAKAFRAWRRGEQYTGEDPYEQYKKRLAYAETRESRAEKALEVPYYEAAYMDMPSFGELWKQRQEYRDARVNTQKAERALADKVKTGEALSFLYQNGGDLDKAIEAATAGLDATSGKTGLFTDKQTRTQARSDRDRYQSYLDVYQSFRDRQTAEDWVKNNSGNGDLYKTAQDEYNAASAEIQRLEMARKGMQLDETGSVVFIDTNKGSVEDQLARAVKQQRLAGLKMEFAQNEQDDEVTRDADFASKAAEGQRRFEEYKASQYVSPEAEAEHERTVARHAPTGNDPTASQEAAQAAEFEFMEREANASRFDPRYHREYMEPDERWTDEERQKFYAMYYDDTERAADYAARINRRYNSEDAAERDLYTEEFATRNALTGAIATAASIPGHLGAGNIDYAKMALEYAYRGDLYETQYEGWSRDSDVARSAIAQKLNEVGPTIDESVPVLGGKGFGDLYQIGASMAESAVAVSMGGGVANAMFFGSAASSTTRDALDRGLSAGQALGLGAAAGAAEVGGETLSIEHLLNQGGLQDVLAKGVFREMLKQGGIEASEEFLTTLANTFADKLISGDKSEYKQNLYTNLANGMSYDEAQRAAFQEWAYGIAMDTLGGFISGAGMSGMRYGGMALKGATTKFTRDRQQLFDTARLTEEGSKAQKLADKYENKEKLSSLQAAKIQAASNVELGKTDKATLTEAATKRLQELGVKNPQKAAEAIADVIAGTVRSDVKAKQQMRLLEKNGVALDVLNDLENALSGKNVEWAKGIQTKNTGRISEVYQRMSDRVRNVTIDGQTHRIERLSMDGGKLNVTYTANGTEHTISADDAKLSPDVQSALKTVKEILGDDAEYALERMERYQNPYDYAVSYATIRDTFGKEGAKESAALASPLRGGLSDTQVIHAMARGYVAHRVTGKTKRGAGVVTTNGGMLNGRELQGVSEDLLKNDQDAANYVEAWRGLAQSMGVPVHFFQSKTDSEGNIIYGSEGDPNGAYVNGELWLDINSGMKNLKQTAERSVFRTAAHELTHFIEHNSDKYEELKEFVTGYLKEAMGEDFNALVKSKIAREPGLSYEGAIHEVVADACETMLKDSKYINKMMDENPGLFETIRGWLRDFFNKILAVDTGAKYLQPVIDQVQKLWDEALQDAVESRLSDETMADPLTFEEAAQVEPEIAQEIVQEEKPAKAKKPAEQKAERNEPWLNKSLTKSEKASLRRRFNAAKKDMIASYLAEGVELTDEEAKKILLDYYATTGYYSLSDEDRQTSNSRKQQNWSSQRAARYGEDQTIYDELSSETQEALDEHGLTIQDGVVVTEENAKLMREEGYEKPQDWDEQFSVKTEPAWEANYLQSPGADPAVAGLIKNITDWMIANKAVYDYVPHGEYADSTYGPLRDNQEYIVTFDMDTSCPRTFQYIHIRDALQRFAKRPLTFNESINLLNIMKRTNQMIPCTYCYVENKRIVKSNQYLNYFAARDGVMSAPTTAAAKKLMYSYNAKKGTLGAAAQKVFEQWREDVNNGVAFHPSADECWDKVMRAQMYISNWLDGQLQIKQITKDTPQTKLKESVYKKFGITDPAAQREVENFVDQWIYETKAEIPHNLLLQNIGAIGRIDQRYLVVHNAAMQYANSSSSARSIDNYVPYTDQLKEISEKRPDIKAFVMGMGGIRKHSSNDFRMDYVQDYLMFYADLAAGGWTGHTYTKSVDFCKIFGRTGDRINLSIAFDTKDGKVVMNDQEGANWSDAKKLRKAYYDNLGTMAMVTDDLQLSYALNSDWIDMIIPFHASGLPKSVWRNMKAWNDYTSKQLEKYLNATDMRNALKARGIKVPTGTKAAEVAKMYNEEFGVKFIYDEKGKRKRPHFYPNDTYVKGPDGEMQLVPGHHNDVETYFRLCDEYGVHPRFYGLTVTDAKGNAIPITEHPNYLKLIKETARTETEQKPIEFNLDQHDDFLGMSPMDYVMERLTQEANSGGYESMKVDPAGIIDLFKKDYIGKNHPIGYISEGAQFKIDAYAGTTAYKEIEANALGLNNTDDLQKLHNAAEDRAQLSTKEQISDSDRLYDETQEAQRQWIDARNRLDQFTKSDEYGKAFDSFLKTSDVDALSKWMESSGLNALDAEEKRLRAEYQRLNSEFNKALKREAADKESQAIKKSGLSEGDYFGKQAVKEFGYTPHYYDAGYITPNGKMLNFSGEKGKHFGVRGQDHRAIGILFENEQGAKAMVKFMGYGNVRIMAESPGIDIISDVEPTSSQYATIRGFIRDVADKGLFGVDITDKNNNRVGSLQYDGAVRPDRVINDIKHYFQTGEIRQQSAVSQFHAQYSTKEQEALEVEQSDVNVQYSVRQGPPPKKTMIGYKVFMVDKKHPGQLYPTKVKNPGGQGTPVGVWLDADTGELARNKDGTIKLNKFGRIAVKANGGTLAWRPGWHLGSLPEANQMNRVDPTNPDSNDSNRGTTGRMWDNYVFCECEFAADEDYQLEAFEYGTDEKGSYKHTQAGLPYIPRDGYYKYRTNPDPSTAPWFISGAIKITKILDDDMRKEIIDKWNAEHPDEPMRFTERYSGKPIDLAEYGFTAGPVKPTQDLSSIAPGVDYSDEIRSLPGYTRHALNFDDPRVQEAFRIQQIEDKKDYYIDRYNQTHKAELEGDRVQNSVKGSHYDYSKSFGEQIDDYKAGKFPAYDTLIVRGTPKVFQKIGLNALPMTFGAGHLQDVLNGTKIDHDFGEALLRQLPKALEEPIAIFVSASQPNSSIVSLVDLVYNGKHIIAPVVIDGFGQQNGVRIDSNAISTAHTRGNAITKLFSDAIALEASGQVGVYYYDKMKTTSILNGSQLRLLSRKSDASGFIHSIRESGSPVKPKINSVLESKQFRNWFGDSKVANADGSPKVVYHQTGHDFTVFNTDNPVAGANDSETPNGIFFKENDHDIGLDGKKQMAVYLSVQNPLHFADRAAANSWYQKNIPGYKSLQDEMNSKIRPIDKQMDQIENDMFQDDVTDEQYNEFDKQWNDLHKQMGEIENDYRGRLRELLNDYFLNNDSGYDGIELDYDGHRYVNGKRENVHTWIVFKNTQVKSATDNIGLYDKNNPDINYSIKTDELSDRDMLLNANSTTDAELAALQDYQAKAQNYTAREKKVSDALREMDRMVRTGASKDAINKQRAKISNLEAGMAKALRELTQAEQGTTIQEILQRERDIQRRRTRQQVNETLSKRELRRRIDALHKSLVSRIKNPTEKKNIPPAVMQQAIDVLEAINMDTTIPGSKRGESVRSKLVELKQRYEELKNDKDFRAAAVYDSQVAEFLENMIKEVGDTPINRMSASQLESVYNVLAALDRTARKALKIRIGNQERDAYEISKAMTRETRSSKKQHTSLLDSYLNAQLSPERFFARMGNHHKNSTWSQIYRMLNDGQLKQTQITMEASMIFGDLLTDKRYDKLIDPKQTVDLGLKDENGKTILITHGMMVALYMHLQNEQNVRHVAYGGLTIPSLKDYYNDKKVKGSENASRVGGVLQEVADLKDQLYETMDAQTAADLQARIDEAGLRAMDYIDQLRAAIDKNLTDYDRQWIAASKELFDGYSKSRLNETTMDVYGIKRANVDNYFPIWVDGDFLNTPFETVAKDMSLENAGFMKERIDSSKPIRLADISDVASSQIRKVSQYCGLMPVIRNFNKIWGKTQTGYRDSVQNAVHQVYGNSGIKYIENLMADLNGARNGGESSLVDMLNAVRGHMAQASLTLNPRVAFGQTASFPSAAAVVGWDALRKAFFKGGKNGQMISRADQDLIRKWSPLLWYRMQGYSTTELGDIAGMNSKVDRIWKKARWLTGWIQAMDGATVGRLWYAAEYYVQDNTKLEKGSDAYYEKVAEIFNDIVEKTQPNYTTMQRPDILRNPQALVKQLTMFLTQRLQNFNVLYDSLATYSQAKQDLKDHAFDTTAEDVRQAGIGARRAVISQVAAAATITAFKFLADALLHSMSAYRDDDKELTKESISLQLLNMFMDSLTGNLLGGSEIYDVIESKVFNKTYYGIELSGISTVMDVVNSTTGFIETAFNKEADGKAKLKAADKLAKNLGSLVGLPFANAEKIVKGFLYTAQDIANGDPWQTAGVDRTTSQQANRLYKAYEDMQYGKVQKIREEVGDDEKLDTQIKSMIKERFVGSELSGTDAVHHLTTWLGVRDKDAEKIVREWQCERDTGIKYDDMREAFLAGQISAKSAANMRIKYGGMEPADAEKTVSKWQCEIDTGIPYEELRTEFIDGNISYNQIVTYMVKYGGRDQEDAEKSAYQYQFIGEDDQYSDVSVTAATKYYAGGFEAAGISKDYYLEIYTMADTGFKADYKANGKPISNSKKNKVMAYIDSLPISDALKDQLYLIDYKESTLAKTPWNKRR